MVFGSQFRYGKLLKLLFNGSTAICEVAILIHWTHSKLVLGSFQDLQLTLERCRPLNSERTLFFNFFKSNHDEKNIL